MTPSVIKEEIKFLTEVFTNLDKSSFQGPPMGYIQKEILEKIKELLKMLNYPEKV